MGGSDELGWVLCCAVLCCAVLCCDIVMDKDAWSIYLVLTCIVPRTERILLLAALVTYPARSFYHISASRLIPHTPSPFLSTLFRKKSITETNYRILCDKDSSFLIEEAITPSSLSQLPRYPFFLWFRHSHPAGYRFKLAGYRKTISCAFFRFTEGTRYLNQPFEDPEGFRRNDKNNYNINNKGV